MGRGRWVGACDDGNGGVPQRRLLIVMCCNLTTLPITIILLLDNQIKVGNVSPTIVKSPVWVHQMDRTVSALLVLELQFY